MSGLGAQWGKWAECLDIHGHPKTRIVRVYQSTWRARVIGGRVARKGEQWKRLAQARAHAVTGWELPSDAAEALCIGLWAQYAPEVGRALGKRYRRACGLEEG